MNGPELAAFRALCADEPPAGPLCAVCFQPRHPERARRYAGDAAAVDPFCSTRCARAFHGTSLPELPSGPRSGRVVFR